MCVRCDYVCMFVYGLLYVRECRHTWSIVHMWKSESKLLCMLSPSTFLRYWESILSLSPCLTLSASPPPFSSPSSPPSLFPSFFSCSAYVRVASTEASICFPCSFGRNEIKDIPGTCLYFAWVLRNKIQYSGVFGKHCYPLHCLVRP